MKTAYELLNGLKMKPPIFQTLSLGETKIPLNNDQQKILDQAIEDKDYYEIKRFVSKLHKS